MAPAQGTMGNYITIEGGGGEGILNGINGNVIRTSVN